jgi:hypothetical protein
LKVINRAKAFLAAYAHTGNVTRAAKAAKISTTAHYKRLKADPTYRLAFEQADIVATGLLEDESTRRAVQGVRKGIYWQGRRVGYQLEYSDGLMMFLLRGRRPDKYRTDKVEHTGKNGGAVEHKFVGTFEELLALYRKTLAEADSDAIN